MLFQFYLLPQDVAFRLLFLYSTSSYSQKLSKGMQSYFLCIEKTGKSRVVLIIGIAIVSERDFDNVTCLWQRNMPMEL